MAYCGCFFLFDRNFDYRKRRDFADYSEKTTAASGNVASSDPGGETMVRISISVCAQLLAVLAIVQATASISFAQSENPDNHIIPITEQAPQQGEPIKVETIQEGSSSRALKAEAVSQIPMQQLSEESRGTVNDVLENLSLFRRMPTIQLEADRRVYEYFTSHPDAAVSFWRAMGISEVQMWQTGPLEYETDTKQGTWGEVKVLLRSQNSYVLTCSGEFQGPSSIKPIQAFALLHLQPKYLDNGMVTHTLDLFVAFPSQTVETIAKLISPVSNKIADRNFEEISLFIEMISLAMTRQPGWIEQISFSMDGLLEGSTDELLRVTAMVYVDAQRKLRGQQVPLKQMMPPVAANVTTPE